MKLTKAEDNENRIIAQRYANAVLEFADEKFTKETILSELADFQISLSNSSELQKVMASPIVSNNDKKKLLDKIFKAGVNKTVLNFLKLLVDKNRFNIFNSIVEECRTEINKEKNMLSLRIISAIELSKSEKAMIKVKLQKVLNKDVELDWDVNDSIIGGLIFESGDNIIDCSLQHKLQTIQKEIIK